MDHAFPQPHHLKTQGSRDPKFRQPTFPSPKLSNTATMVLELHPCTESDIPEFVRITIAAFGTGGGMTQYMVEYPPSEGYINKTIDKHIKSIREEKDITYLKVIDTELDGQMIAGAKWRINQKERTEEELQAQLPVPGADEAGRQATIDFMWYLNRVRKEFMGTKPFYCKPCMIGRHSITRLITNTLQVLHMLITDPAHHRRGAGGQLVRWGTSQADVAQLPCFLESSVMGRPLYTKCGFTPRLEQVFDLTKYGGEGGDMNTVMIRDPVKA